MSEKRICGAHSRRTGNPCKSYAVKGSRRCRMHGGTKLRRQEEKELSVSDDKRKQKIKLLYTRHWDNRRKELMLGILESNLSARETAELEYSHAVAQYEWIKERAESFEDTNDDMNSENAQHMKTAFDRAISHAASERRLASRQLLEAEASVEKESEGTDVPITINIIDSRGPAKAKVVDTE